MLVVDLIRHAQSDWGKENGASEVPRFGGRQNETDLSTEGVKQAGELGSFARRNGMPTAFYASPAKRTVRTHELSVQAMGRSSSRLHIDDRLQEMDWGSWTGQPRSILDTPLVREQRARLGFDFAPPGGESLNAVRERMAAALKDIAAETSLTGYVWVHTHRNVIKAFAAPYLRWSADRVIDAELGEVSLTRFLVGPKTVKMTFFNQSIS